MCTQLSQILILSRSGSSNVIFSCLYTHECWKVLWLYSLSIIWPYCRRGNFQFSSPYLSLYIYIYTYTQKISCDLVKISLKKKKYKNIYLAIIKLKRYIEKIKQGRDSDNSKMDGTLKKGQFYSNKTNHNHRCNNFFFFFVYIFNFLRIRKL